MRPIALSFAAVLAASGTSLADSPPDPGAKLFQQNCAVCHQASGKGVENVVPPLAEHLGDYVRIDGGRGYLVTVVTSGFQGAIEVNGKKFDQIMPSFGHLSDEQVATILNYVLASLNAPLLPKDFAPFTVKEVTGLRPAKKPAARDVLKTREALIAKAPVAKKPAPPAGSH